MSELKLSSEEILTRRKELLEEAENVMEQISQLSHLLEEDGEEFTQFMEYLDDIHDVWVGFCDFDVPADSLDPHYVDIAQAAYRTGTHQVVCDVVTSRLKTGNYVTQAEDDTMATPISNMKTLLILLSNFCQSEDARDITAKKADLLLVLVHTLEAGHRAHVNGELSKTQNSLLTESIRILNNCASDEKNVSTVRGVGAVKILLLYLDSKEGKIQLVSLAALAKLVNEKEATNLLTNHVTIFTLIIQRLDIAWQTSDHLEEWGWPVKALIKTIGRLARNDANKKVLVDKGCLPLLVKALDGTYREEVEVSLETLWVLSFDEDNKQKLVDEPNLVKLVWRKYSDGSSNDKMKKSSYGILWSLMDQLKRGKLKFVGIAAKIEEQKSMADMKTTPTNHQQMQRKSSDGVCFEGHVMLSYNWGHKKTILQICEELKDAGVPVWIDVDFMEGSTLETMAKAVEDCSIFIMAVSKGYKESPNTRLEAGYAQRLNKTIIPLMMERGYKPDGWLGILMESKLFHDFSGKYPFENKMSDLVKEVKKTMGHHIPAGTKKAPESLSRSLSGQQDHSQTQGQTDSDRQTENDQQTDRPPGKKKERGGVTIICSIL